MRLQDSLAQKPVDAKAATETQEALFEKPKDDKKKKKKKKKEEDEEEEQAEEMMNS